MRSAIAALALGLLLALLQGCGQTGPLYLPSEAAGANASGAAIDDPATEPAATDAAADNDDGISVSPATDTE